jgi:hypothetical protein
VSGNVLLELVHGMPVLDLATPCTAYQSIVFRNSRKELRAGTSENDVPRLRGCNSEPGDAQRVTAVTASDGLLAASVTEYVEHSRGL